MILDDIMSVGWDFEGSVNRSMKLLRELSPLQRMIISPGLDKTFEIVKHELPDTIIHEYPTGSKCGDWEVPESWEVVQASIEDGDANIIASFEECPLLVSPFSEPVDGWFSKKEIQNHLTTDKKRPDVFLLEHRNSYDYQLKDWGITLPYNRWSELPDEKYHINISINRMKSSMKVAELFLPGEKDETLCICAHIDELCNDDLSGCVVAIEVMRHLQKIQKRKYSYQMILSPELIGTIFFVGNNSNKVKNTFGMLNLETVGAGDKWNLKHSLKPNSILDKILKVSFTLSGIDHDEIGFFEGYGNDERVYSWPSLSIPSVAIQKHPFYGYHTSLDVPENIDPNALNEALTVCVNLISIIEKNYIPTFSSSIPPYLSKRDLYFDRWQDIENHHKYNNHLLYNIDGENSLVDLTYITDLPFYNIWQYLEKFYEQGLILKNAVKWDK